MSEKIGGARHSPERHRQQIQFDQEIMRALPLARLKCSASGSGSTSHAQGSKAQERLSPRLNQSIAAKPINRRQAGERIMFLPPSGRTTGCGKLHRGGADSRRKALAGQFLEPFLCLTKCTSIIGIKIVPGISGIWSITICVAIARTPTLLATRHRIKQTSCRISGMFILAQTVSPQAQDDCGMGKQPGCPGAIRSHRFSGCKGPFEIEGTAGRESRMLRLKSRPGH
jgi:hypothetical protein